MSISNEAKILSDIYPADIVGIMEKYLMGVNIILHGLINSGKSTYMKELSKTFKHRWAYRKPNLIDVYDNNCLLRIPTNRGNVICLIQPHQGVYKIHDSKLHTSDIYIKNILTENFPQDEIVFRLMSDRYPIKNRDDGLYVSSISHENLTVPIERALRQLIHEDIKIIHPTDAPFTASWHHEDITEPNNII